MSKRRWMLVAAVVAAVGALAGGSALLLWPEPDNWTEEAFACVSNKYAGYWESKGRYTFKLDYENSCDRKVTCAVNVSIQNARESIRDRGVLVFAARNDAPTPQSYSVPVQLLGGIANAQRTCRFT